MPGPREDSSGRGADSWDEETERLPMAGVVIESWAGDGRSIVRITSVLRMDLAPVTHADYARFVDATGRDPPWPGDAPRTELLEQPVVHVHIEDARAYARWAKKRLPVEHEWIEGMRRIGFRTARGGATWEWTASRHREGHVVRGGPYRNRPGTKGELAHRSWEDTGCRAVGFRCVVDG